MANSLLAHMYSRIRGSQEDVATMDSDAFIPFAPEDLTADKAISMERYFAIVDEVYDLLWADQNINTTAMGKAASYRTGYERKIRIDDIPVFFSFDRGMWKTNTSLESPFWVAIGDHEMQASANFKQFLFSVEDIRKEDGVWSLVYFPLEAPIDSTFDEVCTELKRQILRHLELARKHLAK